MTVVVLFSKSAISFSLLPSSVSCISSTLLRLQASMRISFAEAPYGEGTVSATGLVDKDSRYVRSHTSCSSSGAIVSSSCSKTRALSLQGGQSAEVYWPCVEL